MLSPATRGGSQFEGLTGVYRTAVNRVAFATGNRNRLACQRRLVEGGADTRYDAVNGNDLACAYQDHVSDRDLIDRHILDQFIGSPVRDARGAIDEGLQVSLSACDREVLEHIATSVHDRNDCACQGLSKQECSRHGNECDRVDTHSPGHEVSDHRHCEANDDRDRASGPYPAGQHVAPCKPGDDPENQPRQRDRNQRLAEVAIGHQFRHAIAFALWSREMIKHKAAQQSTIVDKGCKKSQPSQKTGGVTKACPPTT